MKPNALIWPLGAAGFTAGVALLEKFGLLSASWWLVPWALSLFLFGLPHGAIDHEVILQLWRPQPPPRWALAAVLAGYLALSLLVFLGWFFIPAIVFFGFILLTLAHWGLGDLWWSWHREPGYFSSRFHQVIFTLARGSLPMLIPLSIDARIFREVAEKTCGLFQQTVPRFDWLESPAVHLAAWGSVLFLVAADGLLGRDVRNSRLLNAAETLALLLFFGLLPPLLSLGFYFAFWHGLRHILRLNELAKNSWSTFARKAFPATLAALLMLGSLPFLTKRPHDEIGLLGVYLALIAALTVPHAVVVAWMDRKAKIWKTV